MTSQGSTMPPTKKKGKAMSRPLSSSIAQGDISCTKSVVQKKVKSSVMASNSAKVSSDKVEKSKEPFRFRWQKKGGFVYQDALIKSKNADIPGEKKVKREVTTKKNDAYEDGDNCNESASGEATLVHPYTGGKTMLPTDDEDSGNDESEIELMQEGSDDEYENGATAGKQPIGATCKKKKNDQEAKMKNKEPNPNGRCKGRKLVMWHRPRMIEKLLLHLQYECHRDHIEVPWDKVVDRLAPGSSGASATQHISKMRDVLITEGHMVPPLLGKKSVPQDPTVRGYIRDLDSDQPTDTKVVRWGELIKDRKDNLEIEGVVRGSGNYRRGLDKAIAKTQKATGMRRNRLPIELQEEGALSNGTAATTKKHTKVKKEKKISSAFSSRSGSVDPAELDSDDEYDPSASKKKGKYGGRTRGYSAHKYCSDVSEEEDDDEFGDEFQEPARRDVGVNTPQNKSRMGHQQGLQGLTPPSSLEKIVKLQVGQDAINRLIATGKIGKNKDKDTGTPGAQSGNDMQDDSENGYLHGAVLHTDVEEFGEYGAAAQYAQAPSHLLAQDVVGPIGYQGMSIHGTKAQYQKAIQDGHDPKANGIKYQQATGSMSSENRPSYSLAAPPAYPATDVRQPFSPLAGTSAGAFTGFGSPNGATMTAVNYNSFDENPVFMNGFGGQGSASVEYGAAEQTMSDEPFFSSFGFYNSGSNLFNNDSAAFRADGLPATSYDDYHDQKGLDMGLDGNVSFDTTDHHGSVAQTSSASGFQGAADNTSSTTPANLESQDDAVSLAPSTPPHYLQYAQQDDGDDKENRDWYEY